MKRLIQKGLMFGNLVRVDSPVLVERYNRALKWLIGKETALEEFHVDISGFSPEVGFELGDDQYLNHAGVNRQFILLTTAQKTAPLLNARFSTSRGIIRQFIHDNEPQLFALTSRDAVAGELVNSVYSVETPARLFDILNVSVEADTTTGTVAVAEELGAKIDRFKTAENAWWDDVLIAEMIELARKTGDLTRNPVRLSKMSFSQSNFWTSHFGGVYLFRDVARPAAIARLGAEALGDVPIEAVYDFDDRGRIAAFLNDNDLVEPIVKARGIDAAAILHQKMDFIVADIAGVMGEDLKGATRRDLRQMGRRFASLLPPEWQGLAALARWAEDGGPWPRIDSDHPAYFYTLRAKNHADADLVNMLLSELCPLDIRQLFICHKQAFYAAYEGWSDAKKDYVADFLYTEYTVDKAGTRDALFGHEEPMDEPASGPWQTARDAGEPLRPVSDARIESVGPWGHVRRNARKWP